MLEIAVFALAAVAALLLLAYFQAPILAWTLASGVLLASWAAAFEWSGIANGIVLACFVVLGAILNVNLLRRKIVSDHVLAMFRRILPDMSQTEKEAIDAGTV